MCIQGVVMFCFRLVEGHLQMKAWISYEQGWDLVRWSPERHDLPSLQIEKIICSLCDHEQDVKEVCEKCGLYMSDYYCAECKLFYDEITCRATCYHCDRCGTNLLDSNTEDSMASASSSFPAPSSSDYYSPEIAKMIMALKNNPGLDKVEFEVEASKPTWTELSASVVEGGASAAENSKAFRSLQEQWGRRFFQEWKEGEWEVLDRIAEGGQAEIFLLGKPMQGLRHKGHIYWETFVIKMFKEGLSLQGLQRLLPHGMLGDEDTRDRGLFNSGHSCNE